uniref:Uncharacterized protein n=1 Tax=Lactuca sativa TaxID=4236 RepID=A0A9R1XI50_LACSA|nr:hypothetical protein LSAT_V11C400177180 [Lactuca sativa]
MFATNVVFNPDIPEVHRGLGLDDFVNFLASCRLRYAISDIPSEFFPAQVCEFYYTTTVNDDNNAITGTIGRGRHSVFITVELLSAALRLPIFEPFSELPSIERCRRMFDQLGYDHSKAGWKFFTGALCKCVGHKSRSGDQLSNYEQQVVCSLLLNKRLDYGALFFDQLVQLLRTNVRTDHVPFPCWIALVLDKFFAADYFSHSGNPIQCPRMSIRMYQDDPLDTDIGISDRMREWIANPYTVPSLTADTDEGGADGIHEDPAGQEDEPHDGGQFSPQLSHHIISNTEKVPSALKDSMSQGEQQFQGEHPSQGENPPSSPAAPAASLIQIPASAFTELLTLTRDMSQRLPRIEADVHQLKEVLLHTPPSSPQSDDAQKGGDTDDDANADDEPNERDTEPVDNTIVQPESPKLMHEYDSVGPNSLAATEKLVEDSEHDDEPDDECQILDMNFINPLIPVQEESSDDLDNESQRSDMKLVNSVADPIFPVQGEDSDVSSEDSHPLSRKRKVADTDLAHSQTNTSLPAKKPKSIVSISNLAAEWNMSPDQVKQILDERPQHQGQRTKFQVDGEDVLVLDFGAGGINNSLPISVDPVQHKFISAPEHGMFYLDKNRKMCFQRTVEIPKAPTTHLIDLRQMCMSHQDLSGEFHILIAMELLNRRQELLDNPYWPVKIEAEAEYEEFLSRDLNISAYLSVSISVSAAQFSREESSGTSTGRVENAGKSRDSRESREHKNFLRDLKVKNRGFGRVSGA